MIAQALLLFLSVFALGGCVLHDVPPPELQCRICYLEDPCPPDWIALREGGCMLVVDPRVECPSPEETDE